jgi:hypothetical protein
VLVVTIVLAFVFPLRVRFFQAAALPLKLAPAVAGLHAGRSARSLVTDQFIARRNNARVRIAVDGGRVCRNAAQQGAALESLCAESQ